MGRAKPPLSLKTMKTHSLINKIMSALAAMSVAAAFFVLSFSAKEANAAPVTNEWSQYQLTLNPFFKNNSYLSVDRCTKTYNAAEYTYLITSAGTANYSSIYQTMATPNPIIIGHKYYAECSIASSSDNSTSFNIHLSSPAYTVLKSVNEPNSSGIYYGEATAAGTAGNIGIALQRNTTSSYLTGSYTIDYFVLFDLTGLFDFGNEPTADQFHQMFIGWESGYNQGMADGMKTQISSDITTWTTSKNSVTIPSTGATIYNAKYVGAYSDPAKNLYWNSSAYSHCNNVITFLDPLYYSTREGTYFQLCSFTKYLNTSKNDIDFSTSIELTAGATAHDCTVTWTAYYTTQSMAQWNDLASYNTVDPIKPSQTFINYSEVIGTGTATIPEVSESGLYSVDINATRSNITDSTYSVYILATASYSMIGSAAGEMKGWQPNTATSTFTMDKSLSITYQVIDLPNMFYTVLTAPFTFISIGFNVTLFSGTPYALNISSLLLGIIGIGSIFFVIKVIIAGIKKV